MNQVKRYECWPEHPGHGPTGEKMFEDNCGPWMRFSEVEPLVKALEEVLKAFPAPVVLDTLESDIGPGHRNYRSEPLSDKQIRQLRAELARWKPTVQVNKHVFSILHRVASPDEFHAALAVDGLIYLHFGMKMGRFLWPVEAEPGISREIRRTPTLSRLT